MQGETVTRPLFGHDGELRKEQTYKMIDQAGGDINFYRFMFSPDPEMAEAKAADLWMMTQQVVLKLEERLGMPLQFAAVEHIDQTEIRHIHSIVLIPGRLNVADLEAMHQAADAALTP